MALERIVSAFKESSLMAKLGIGSAIVAVLFLVGNTRTWISHFKDSAADKKQIELKQESDVWRLKAEKSEAEAIRLGTDAKIADLAAEAAGKATAEKLAQLKVEDQRAADDAAQAGETVDAVERCRRLCDRAKRLKLIAANADCGCS